VVRQRDQRANEQAASRPVVHEADQPAVEGPVAADPGALDRPLVRDADQPRSIAGQDRALVIGCGALARELVALTGGLPGVDVACLSPDLHNRPDRIPGQVRDRIREARADGYERIFIAYADCGTGGLLDPVVAEEGVERLAGAHCYEFFAGRAAFAEMADDEPATFWLTDFLARNFERLVIRGLGIDRHPELEPMYFANYRRLVYLSQVEDPELRIRLELGQRGRYVYAVQPHSLFMGGIQLDVERELEEGEVHGRALAMESHGHRHHA